jgi:hypothetical protein
VNLKGVTILHTGAPIENRILYVDLVPQLKLGCIVMPNRGMILVCSIKFYTLFFLSRKLKQTIASQFSQTHCNSQGMRNI